MTVQQKSAANAKLLARLTDELRDQAAHDAVYERLRGLVADAINGVLENRPLLNGTSFVLNQGGRDWTVHVQDVEGLVDIYLASPKLLALLPIDAGVFASSRDSALKQIQPGERFPTLEASLARFGTRYEQLDGLVTQISQSGYLRQATMPIELRERSMALPPGIREGEQVTKISISIR